MENTAAYVYTSLAFPQKDKKNTITICFNKPTPRYRPWKIENRCSNKNLYINIHSSTVHNSQKVEMTEMSIKGWMDKQNG